MGESGVCYICREDCVVARIPCPAGGTCKNPICIDCVAGWVGAGVKCAICRKSPSSVVREIDLFIPVPNFAELSWTSICLMFVLTFVLAFCTAAAVSS